MFLFEEVEAVIDYIALKLTQKVFHLDLAKRLRSEAQHRLCIKSTMKKNKKHEQQEEMIKQSIFLHITRSETKILLKI